jgi:hypothetical protein
MSQLDQAIQDFVTKQNLILAQYQAGNNDLRNDVKTLVRELLLAKKGLGVIDQGNVFTKCSFGTALTDFTNISWNSVGAVNPLNVMVLDLKGARKVRIAAGADIPNGQLEGSNTPCGIFGFFSDNSVDTPKANDFALLGSLRFFQYAFEGANAQNMTLDTPANLGTLAGTITGNIFPTSENVDSDNTFAQEVEIECATSKFLYLIFPCFIGGADLFNPAQNQEFNWYATYQLLG